MKKYSIGDICTVAANNLKDQTFQSRMMDKLLPSIALPPIFFLFVDDLLAWMVALAWIPLIWETFRHEVVQFDQGMPDWYEKLKSRIGLIWMVYDGTTVIQGALMLVALEAYVIGLVALVAANLGGDWNLFKDMALILMVSVVMVIMVKPIPALLRKIFPELVGVYRRAM